MNYKAQLKQLLQEKAVIKGEPVRLASGQLSNVYVDARQVTLDPEGAYLTASLLFDLLTKEGVKAIGGPTIGADPMVAATVALSYLKKQPLSGFLIRKEPKKHGRQRQIEGLNLTPNLPVALVEDVVTTGGSILKAAAVVQEAGANIKLIVALVDREQGGEESLTRAGFWYTSIFKLSDLLQIV